ncbi:NADH dehydrogenase [ubiquinone] iron-sulfur protein 6, mitochondrial [Phalaenopsis equestris]|uniref:NADH dehydrogenase [ubiquinone] iron-sulfur protein 6, mitochondrial n=1 Tax=Phalaenopsis equestris TaxID=78828 RepID=UPI0009E393C2|nr:NADH dehydrogenase [ubiquinone] iron-sulfur protein 6, mitochondrial [Phalaenopsis equestris]
MAAVGLSSLFKTLDRFTLSGKWSFRAINSLVGEHTAKWMQDSSRKSPMQLINEVPPIKVEGRIVACEGDSNPALGHPIEFICLDLKDPAVCKYCGLRFVQHHHHH